MLKEYLLNNSDLLIEITDKLNELNKCLYNLTFYQNAPHVLNSMFEPYELMSKAYYGCYSLRDDWFKFNKTGKLLSYTEEGRIQEYKDNIDIIIKMLKKYYKEIHMEDKELKRLLNL